MPTRCALLLLALAGACAPPTPTPPPFSVSHASPRLATGAPPVLLNEALTVYFSAPIEPLSITTDSVALVDEAGHKVPGSLRAGANWVMFVPEPPLAADLDDGSYRPGSRNELRLAGLPLPDAIRSADGRRLSASLALPVQIARLDQAPAGLPAPLRPPGDDLPLRLRAPTVLQRARADEPRLQLHFTAPLLPRSVTPAAFEVIRMRDLRAIVPRAAHLYSSRLDALPGSSVEIDLGGEVAGGADGDAGLRPGDFVSVTARTGADGVRDLRGNAVLPDSPPCWWEVVAGAELMVAEWPGPGDAFVAADGMAPGFELRGGLLQPKVRVEAGDGSLGVLRPKRDLVLQPGVPFDRGDGQMVMSRGTEFPFLAIAIPAGVTLTLEGGSVGMQLRCCGEVHIDGTLQVRGPRSTVAIGRAAVLPVRDLVEATPTSIVAALDIHVTGALRADAGAGEGAPLLLASAGIIHLAAELPVHTLLAVEALAPTERSAIRGQIGRAHV